MSDNFIVIDGEDTLKVHFLANGYLSLTQCKSDPPIADLVKVRLQGKH